MLGRKEGNGSRNGAQEFLQMIPSIPGSVYMTTNFYYELEQPFSLCFFV